LVFINKIRKRRRKKRRKEGKKGRKVGKKKCAYISYIEKGKAVPLQA